MVSNGSRNARTAADVAQLESDNEYLMGENERLSRELAVVTADRSRLQVENAMLEGRARENLVKATRMETIVRQVSAGLVSALQEITQERTVERTVRRQVQESQLEEETGPAPSFLRRDIVGAQAGGERSQTAPASGPQVQSEARRESDQDREDRLRGAAERVSRPPNYPPRRMGQIDPSLADKDSRLPVNQMPPRDLDAEELANLGGEMKSNKSE
jgi:hypothetical protein